MSRRKARHLASTGLEDVDELEQQSCVRKHDTVLRYEVKLITPALLGGFLAREHDADHPFREKAIRGRWRFWWRWMMRAGLLDDLDLIDGIKPSQASPKQRRELENRVWGTVHAGEDVDGLRSDVATMAKSALRKVHAGEEANSLPSRVSLQIKSVDDVAFADYQVWDWVVQPTDQNPLGRKGWCITPVARPLQYALSGAAAQKRPDQIGHVPPRKLVMPGARFELEVCISALRSSDGSLSQDTATVSAVSRLLGYWATFCGLGSRCRRGLGAVTVSPIDGAPATLPVGLFERQADASAQSNMCWSFDSGQVTDHQLIGFLVNVPGRRPEQVLHQAMRQMSDFRQGEGIGRHGHRGRSLWHEADLGRTVAGESTRHHNPHINPLLYGLPPVQAVPRGAFGHFELRFAPKDTRLGNQNDPDPSPRQVLPQVTGEDGQPLIADRLPSSMLMRPLVWVDRHGQPQTGILMAQFQHMAGKNIPDMMFKPAGSGGAMPTAFPAARAKIEAADWSRIAPLNHADCMSGVFAEPQDAAQAFMNFAYNRMRG